MRELGITAVSLCLALGAGCRATQTAEPRTAGGVARIVTRAQLDHHLATHAKTPLGALSPGARNRFAEGLVFREHGLVSFDVSDLRNELDFERTEKILSLFGSESYARVVFPGGPEAPSQGRLDTAAQGVSKLDGPLEAFRAVQREARALPVIERGPQLAAAYLRLFPGPDDGPAEGLTAQDLRLQLMAARTVVDHQPDAPHVDEVLRVFRALERGGRVRAFEAEDVQSVLVRGRRFDEAAAFAKRFPELLPPFPAFEALDVPVARSVWEFDAQRTLVQRAVPELIGAKVIVLGSTGCHFTANAVKAIDADPELRRLLDGALWLAPAADPIRVDAIVGWEQQYPWAPLQIVNREAEWWPEFKDWGLPTFVFVKDGEIQTVVTGWPPEGRRSELMAAAALLGLPITP